MRSGGKAPTLFEERSTAMRAVARNDGNLEVLLGLALVSTEDKIRRLRVAEPLPPRQKWMRKPHLLQITATTPSLS